MVNIKIILAICAFLAIILANLDTTVAVRNKPVRRKPSKIASTPKMPKLPMHIQDDTETFNIEVEDSDTIGTIKKKLAEQVYRTTPIERMILLYNDTEQKNEDTAYKIIKYYLTNTGPLPNLHTHIQDDTETFNIEVEDLDDIAAIKRKLAEQVYRTTPIERMILLYNDTEQKNEDTAYKIIKYYLTNTGPLPNLHTHIQDDTETFNIEVEDLDDIAAIKRKLAEQVYRTTPIERMILLYNDKEQKNEDPAYKIKKFQLILKNKK